MQKFVYILFTQLLLNVCLGQNTFDVYRSTGGYHNSFSHHIKVQPDSGALMINFVIDSATMRQDLNVLRVKSNGSEKAQKTFNLFNLSYGFNPSVIKTYVDVSQSSFFCTGPVTTGTTQGVMINKINKTTLDTMKNYKYGDNFEHYMHSFVMLDDNRFYLIGNRWNNSTEVSFPLVFQLDSNLNLTKSFTVATPHNFNVFNAILDPVDNNLVLQGQAPVDQYPQTFFKMDSLGNLLDTAYSSSSYSIGISQIYFSHHDSTYLAIGGKTISKYANYRLYRLYVCKYDRKFNRLWEKTYGDMSIGHGLNDAVELRNGDFAISGSYAQYNATPLVTANYNGSILKISPKGNLRWVRIFDNVPGMGTFRMEQLLSIDTTLEKGFYACGIVYGYQPHGQAWVIKTDSNGCVTPGCPTLTMAVDSTFTPIPPALPDPVDTSTVVTNTLSLHALVATQPSRLRPNPVKDKLSVELDDNLKDGFFVLTDLNGHTVMEQYAETANFEVDVSNLPKGVYMATFKYGSSEVILGKIVKE